VSSLGLLVVRVVVVVDLASLFGEGLGRTPLGRLELRNETKRVSEMNSLEDETTGLTVRGVDSANIWSTCSRDNPLVSGTR